MKSKLISMIVVVLLLVGGTAVCFTNNNDASVADSNDYKVDGGIKWIIEGDTLTIKPATEEEIEDPEFSPGQMDDYDSSVAEEPHLAPWAAACKDVTTIKIVNDGQNTISTIGEAAFCQSGISKEMADYSKITKVELPDTIKTIKKFAFSGAGSKTGFTINIPAGIELILSSAFSGSTISGELSFPGGVLIAQVAFSKCTGITKITFGAGESNAGTSIDHGAFSYCGNIDELGFYGTIESIGTNAFIETFPKVLWFDEEVTVGSVNDNYAFGYEDSEGNPIPMQFKMRSSGLPEIFNNTNKTHFYGKTFEYNSSTKGFDEAETATITVKADPEAGGTVEGSGTYIVGNKVTIKATANTGYHFVKWDDGNTDATREITVSADKTTYTAEFATDAPTTVTITVTASEGGTVTGGGTYSIGASVTITATANTGYHFVKWDDGNTDASRTITVSADKTTYNAIFEADGPSPAPTQNNDMPIICLCLVVVVILVLLVLAWRIRD